MKKIIALCICAVLLGTLAACAGAPSLQPSAYTDADFDTSGDIVLKTDKDTYDGGAAEVTYTIQNNTAEKYAYGLPYAVEVNLDGKWYTVPFPENTAWDAVAVVLEANGTNAGSFKLSELAYKFTGGNYRLIKEIGNKRYFAEFRIAATETPGGGGGYIY